METHKRPRSLGSKAVAVTAATTCVALSFWSSVCAFHITQGERMRWRFLTHETALVMFALLASPTLRWPCRTENGVRIRRDTLDAFHICCLKHCSTIITSHSQFVSCGAGRLLLPLLARPVPTSYLVFYTSSLLQLHREAIVQTHCILESSVTDCWTWYHFKSMVGLSMAY